MFPDEDPTRGLEVAGIALLILAILALCLSGWVLRFLM